MIDIYKELSLRYFLCSDLIVIQIQIFDIL